MLRLENVTVRYGGVRALESLNLVVGAGEIVALLGANGAGKSTTLRTISGLVHPAEGRVLLDGQPIHRLSPESIVHRRVIHVPEGRQIFPELSVEENLLLGGYGRGSRADLAARLVTMTDRFPVLGERRHQRGGTLSGGEQQMLAIARGLMAEPRLLLLDEPSLGLAPQVVVEIFRIIREISAGGVAVLLAEQNAELALAVAHRAGVLETGQIVYYRPAPEQRRQPRLRAAYLGGAG